MPKYVVWSWWPNTLPQRRRPPKLAVNIGWHVVSLRLEMAESFHGNNSALVPPVPVQSDLRTHKADPWQRLTRSEEHTSELQSRPHLVCRLLLEKKKTK